MEPKDINEQETELDPFILDCADFFMAVLQRKYPTIDFQLRLSRPWRLCWEMTTPKELTHAVEEDAFFLMQELFRNHGVLVSFFLVEKKEESDA